MIVTHLEIRSNRTSPLGHHVAITNNKRIGKIRIRLAEMLEEKLPGIIVDPADLESQNPYYSSQQFDCCTWTGYGTREKHWDTYFFSWDTMGDLVKYDFEMGTEYLDLPNHYECFSLRRPDQKSNRAALN